jgi:hypothetical protein
MQILTLPKTQIGYNPMDRVCLISNIHLKYNTDTQNTYTPTHIPTYTQAHRHKDTHTLNLKHSNPNLYTDTQAHRHTDTQTHRHTHRHTGTQTHRHPRHPETPTHRPTDTQTLKPKP